MIAKNNYDFPIVILQFIMIRTKLVIKVKSLTTRDKFLEFDVPNLPGQAYEVVLRVQNHVGTTHRDTIIITVEPPLDMNALLFFRNGN